MDLPDLSTVVLWWSIWSTGSDGPEMGQVLLQTLWSDRVVLSRSRSVDVGSGLRDEVGLSGLIAPFLGQVSRTSTVTGGAARSRRTVSAGAMSVSPTDGAVSPALSAGWFCWNLRTALL